MATSSIKTNQSNDLYLPDGRNLELVQDMDACVQDTRSKTLMRTGEDIYDATAGVDYFQYIFSPQQSYDDARQSLTDAILSGPDITGIESLEIQIDSGTFFFEATVVTPYGRRRVSNV